MSVRWTTQIMHDINALDWGDGYPSREQRDEMKKIVIRWRQELEQTLGYIELTWRRGVQVEEERKG